MTAPEPRPKECRVLRCRPGRFMRFAWSVPVTDPSLDEWRAARTSSAATTPCDCRRSGTGVADRVRVRQGAWQHERPLGCPARAPGGRRSRRGDGQESSRKLRIVGSSVTIPEVTSPAAHLSTADPCPVDGRHGAPGAAAQTAAPRRQRCRRSSSTDTSRHARGPESAGREMPDVDPPHQNDGRGTSRPSATQTSAAPPI